MKRPLTSAACGLIASLLFATTRGVAQEVEVNGIAVLGKLKSAVLLVGQPATIDRRSVLLCEGESDGGIRLLSVNAATASVQIDNGGQIQTLRISAAANFSRTRIAAMANEAAEALAQDTTSPGQAGRNRKPIDYTMIPGNPGWGTLPPLNRVGQPKQLVANQTPVTSLTIAPAPTQSSVAHAPTETPAALPEWYQTSADIEQDRMATAADVLAGKAMPLPRTPLTPATTPANLVDNVNGVYANHMADFITRDWSQM